jgi:hypothetical protein
MTQKWQAGSLGLFLSLGACSRSSEGILYGACDNQTAEPSDLFADGWTIDELLTAAVVDSSFAIPLVAGGSASATIDFDTSAWNLLGTATDCDAITMVQTRTGSSVRVVREADDVALIDVEAGYSRIEVWLDGNQPVLTSSTYVAVGPATPAFEEELIAAGFAPDEEFGLHIFLGSTGGNGFASNGGEPHLWSWSWGDGDGRPPSMDVDDGEFD